MEIKNKDCKGCLLYEDSTCEPHRLKYHRIEECPCGKCLVKMICKDACESYSEFRKGILYSELRKEIYGNEK